MFDLKKYFVRIKLKEKIISEGVQVLPYSTPTISKFCFLPEETLEDLTGWGYENTGYINVLSEKIDEYSVEQTIFESSKKFLCEEVSKSFGDPISFGVSFGGFAIAVDDKMKASLAIKSVTALRNRDAKFNIKCNNTFHEFTSDEILELCDIICEEGEKFTDGFKEIYFKMNEIESFADLRNLSL